ncbi:MAG: alpha/beta fold hydrolase [Myxococcales bacterium]|nr:alpha/beta fold hydrolase [Myxococcales bacterium]
MTTLLLHTALAQASPLRLALAVPEPRAAVSAQQLAIALHDTDADGPDHAVVCLHAVGHGGGDYASVISALAPERRVVVLDWPGHGASEDDPHPPSAQRYAAVLLDVLDALELRSVVLVGNSVGGAAAIEVASAQPHRVRGLVLVDSGGMDPGGWLARIYIGSVVRRFRRGEEDHASFPRWYERFYDTVLPGSRATERRRAIVAAGPQMAGVLRQAWESFASPQADLRAKLPGLSMPVLVAWAERDRVIRWSRNRRAIRRIPNAEVHRFEGGHSAFLEDPEAFTQTLTAFLDAHSL